MKHFFTSFLVTKLLTSIMNVLDLIFFSCLKRPHYDLQLKQLYPEPYLDDRHYYNHGPGQNRRNYISECHFKREDYNTFHYEAGETWERESNSFFERPDMACRKTLPMLTDQGVCRVMNAREVRDVYEPTEYMEALLESIEERNEFSWRDFKIQGQGELYSVRLVLDTQEYMREWVPI